MNTYRHTSAPQRYVLRDAACELAVLADVGRRTSSWLWPATHLHAHGGGGGGLLERGGWELLCTEVPYVVITPWMLEPLGMVAESASHMRVCLEAFHAVAA